MRSSRWLAFPVVAFSLIFVTGGAATSKRTLPIRVVEVRGVDIVSVKQQRQLRSLSRKVASAQVATWKCQGSLGEPRLRSSVSPWALPKSVAYRKWVVKRWAGRASACGARKAEYERQRNWRAFPSWIIHLGVCESGGSGGAPPGHPNWNAEGSSSDGTFYSAFNISRSVYDRDAHHMGVRGWNEGPGIPSPYEQAMAVIGHMRLYGDGFTGRCHGIARSSW